MKKNHRILVVEDDPTLNQVIRFKLAKAGFCVDSATNGAEALERLTDGGFHLIVTDEMMPVMTGQQLCGALQQRPDWGRIPVIMLTVKALELDTLALQALGVVEILPKPFSPTLLLRSIDRVLASSRLPALAIENSSPPGVAASV